MKKLKIFAVFTSNPCWDMGYTIDVVTAYSKASAHRAIRAIYPNSILKRKLTKFLGPA